MLMAGFFWACPLPSTEPPRPGPSTLNPPAAMPCLVVTPSELDFGEVENLNTGFERLQVSNPGRFMRTVTASTPLAFSISPVSVQLPAQSTRAFVVQFQPADALLHLGELELNGGQGCTATVRLRGLGQGSLSVVPELLDFGFVQPGSSKTLELSVVNTRRMPQLITAASLLPEMNSAFSVVLPSRFELAPSSAVSFSVTASPPDEEAHHGLIELGSSEGFLGARLIVQGGAPPMAALSTDALELPVVGFMPGSSPPSFAQRVVQLRNASTGNSTLTLVAPFFEREAFDGGVVDELDLQVTDELARGIEVGRSAPVLVRFVPRAIGTRRYRVTLFTNDPIRPEQVFTFGANVQPLPACSLEVVPPQELLLTPQPDGTSSGAITFTNVGANPCVVDDVRLDDPVAPSFSLVNPEPQVTIAPGESHAVRIVGPRALFGSTTVLGFHVFNRDSVREFINLQAPP